MSQTLLLLGLAVLIGLNGLFVSAEFALVTVRRGAIEERAAAGERRAAAVLSGLENLSFVLSAAQFGITATSLLVGLAAEPALGPLLAPLLEAAGMGQPSAAALALTLAFLTSTVAQMLLGELAPKNVAIARPETTALLVGGPMRLFGLVFGPLIRVFDNSAIWVSARVFGTEPAEELTGGHSLEELSHIIRASGRQGALTTEQTEMLGRAVELGDRRLSSVMVPRPDVIWLEATDTLETLRGEARRTGHSRFPIAGASQDDIVGTIHIKDLLEVPVEERATTTVAELATPPMLVAESETLRRMLTRLRAGHRTFAVVIDEYGGVAGIVTVEDLVEELVGEIEDEFDPGEREIRPLGGRRYAVDGAMSPAELADRLGLELPEGDYETVAGFVITQLGRIPEQGDQTVYEGWRIRVAAMEGMRVAELQVRAPRGAGREGS